MELYVVRFSVSKLWRNFRNREVQMDFDPSNIYFSNSFRKGLDNILIYCIQKENIF